HPAKGVPSYSNFNAYLGMAPRYRKPGLAAINPVNQHTQCLLF
ncbi:MAG: hypothetical protein ACI9LZ_004161, partial [Glaciecola sp.]